MGIAAEYTAANYSISRSMQDEYALLSYQRSRNAHDGGFYREEIVPLGELEMDEAFLKKRPIEAIISRANRFSTPAPERLQQPTAAAYQTERPLSLYWKKKKRHLSAISQCSGLSEALSAGFTRTIRPRHR